MSSLARFQEAGTTVNTDYYIGAPDILIVAPRPGTLDNVQAARINIDFQSKFARDAGKKCAVVVIMAGLLSQDAKTRQVYAQGMQPDLFYGAALVVSNPLTRALASFFMGLSRPIVETRTFGSVESAIEWLESVRPQAKP